MSRIIDIPREEANPSRSAVLRAMGVPDEDRLGERAGRVLDEACAEYRMRVDPRGICEDVDIPAFGRIYEGEGRNADPSPLAAIHKRAQRLVLFAVTVGPEISDRIPALFEEGRLALGATLDAAASEGAELSAEHLQNAVLSDARGRGSVGPESRALRYSPGYCGWDMTGQRSLFAALEPEAIGIHLLESCLMEPLKSISGVIVIGPPEVHEFEDNYAFCSECRTRECRKRLKTLRETST